MKYPIPSEEEVRTCVEEFFAIGNECSPENLLSALIPMQPKAFMSKGKTFKIIPYAPLDEMSEAVELSASMDDLQHQLREYPKVVTRLRMLSYCHIFEMDFHLLVLWNLLRAKSELKCESVIKVLTKKKKLRVLRYPNEKIDAIYEVIENDNLKIDSALKQLWRRKLRNSFTHSQYFIEPDGSLWRTEYGYWPKGDHEGDADNSNSQKEIDEEDIQVHFPPKDIADLYAGVTGYFKGFLELYYSALKPFEDGSPHPTQYGDIVYDAKRRLWHWGGTSSGRE